MERDDARKLQAEYWENTDRAVLELIAYHFEHFIDVPATECQVRLKDVVRQLQRALEETGYRRESIIWRQWESAWISMKWEKLHPTTEHEKMMRKIQAIGNLINLGIQIPNPQPSNKEAE